MKTKKQSAIVSIIVWIVVCLAVGYVSSLFTTPSIATWYASLNQPAFSPPNWVFFPVWTTLYILMGIATGLVWTKRSSNKKAGSAVNLFVVQLILNFAWSYIFFTLHKPWWAFAEIVVLWIVLLWTIVSFKKVSATSAYLLVPYILWVTFASVLNLAVAMLN